MLLQSVFAVAMRIRVNAKRVRVNSVAGSALLVKHSIKYSIEHSINWENRIYLYSY